MAETEPKGLSPDVSFMLAWNVNRMADLASDPESLASMLAEVDARLHDESLENTHRVVAGALYFALRNLQIAQEHPELGTGPAEVYQQLVEFVEMFNGDQAPA